MSDDGATVTEKKRGRLAKGSDKTEVIHILCNSTVRVFKWYIIFDR